MSTPSICSLTWCIVGLFLSIITAPAMAVEGEQEMQEMNYLFAGMLQERSKLKSWSCTITGVDHGRSFETKLLAKGENVRFSRTTHLPDLDAVVHAPGNVKVETRKPSKAKVVHIPAHDEVEHVCDNKQMIVAWLVSDHKCITYKSTPSLRDLLHLWDPRTACIILDRTDTDYQRAINDRLKFWRNSFTIARNGALWTGTFTKQHEFQEDRLSITVDTEHGFTPVRYFGDFTFKPNSKYPGKVEVNYEATAKWEQIDGVWVPTHHRYVRGDGQVVAEYKVSWDWVNKDVDDKEFTIDALGVPGDVPKIYMDDKGYEIRKNTSLPVEKRTRQRGKSWIRWVGYALGLLLIALALLRYRLRKKPSNST